MRRATLGLAAAAVIAGAVGFAGAAQASPSYLTLDQTYGASPNNVLTVGDVNWIVDSCSVNLGNGSCSQIALVLNGANVQFEATTATTGVFAALSSLSSISDFSVDFEEFTTSGSKSFGQSFYNVTGGTGVDSASLVVGPNTSGSYVNGIQSNSTIGNAASGYPGLISFAPVNDVIYLADNHVTSGLTTITAGTPVPEPGSVALFGLGLIGIVVVRRRAASRAAGV